MPGVQTCALPIDRKSTRLNSSHTLIVCRLLGKEDRKSTRLNSSHTLISYAVFCLKKKKRLVELLQRLVRLVLVVVRDAKIGADVDVLRRLFFFNDAAPTELYPLPLHDALPI